MKENDLFERQYGKKKLKYYPPKQYLGIRRILSKYDINRISACTKLAGKGKRCLDIGCNDGHLLRCLSAKYEELYGMDISATIINEAVNKTQKQMPDAHNNFHWVIGNAGEKIPFENEFLDFVISVATIPFIYDLFNLVKEIKRVVKQGGYVVIQVPNIAYILRRINLLIGKLPTTSAASNWEEVGWDGGSIHYFTLKKLCWLFEINGFKVVDKTGSGFLAKFRNWLPSLLSADLIIRAVKI